MPLRQFPRWAAYAIIVCAILAPLVIPITFVYTLVNINEHDNATRCAVVGLVDQLTENSRRNYAATLASPTASAAQKSSASANLNAIEKVRNTTADELGHPTGPRCQ